MDSSQRISVLTQKLSELRKTYNNVKTELACIDRRRKKLRRREREGMRLFDLILSSADGTFVHLTLTFAFIKENLLVCLEPIFILDCLCVLLTALKASKQELACS